MLRIITATFVLMLFPTAHAQSRTPPADNCLDARQIAEMRQSDPRTLAVMNSTGGRFRITLRDDCPNLEYEQDVKLLAPEGWACGGPHELVRHANRDCAVDAIESIDARSYAALARAADRDGIATLDTVQVQSQHPGQHGFRGSHNYCFNPRNMRGWSEDPRGLTVETSPRLNGGNRFYRVELPQTCILLSNATTLRFISGLGIGIICGNAGDRIALGTESGKRNQRAECEISAVYPGS